MAAKVEFSVRAAVPKSGGQSRDFVAVTVPDIDGVAHAIEELRTIGDVERSGAKFTPAGELDVSPEMVRHQHQAVADSENRNP